MKNSLFLCSFFFVCWVAVNYGLTPPTFPNYEHVKDFSNEVYNFSLVSTSFPSSLFPELNRLIVYWNITGNLSSPQGGNITFKVVCLTHKDGWCAFGFSPNGKMKDSEVYSSFGTSVDKIIINGTGTNSAAPYCGDVDYLYFCPPQTVLVPSNPYIEICPQLDAGSTASIDSFNSTHQYNVFSFSRPLKSRAPCEFNILPGVNNVVIFAMGVNRTTLGQQWVDHVSTNLGWMGQHSRVSFRSTVPGPLSYIYFPIPGPATTGSATTGSATTGATPASTTGSATTGAVPVGTTSPASTSPASTSPASTSPGTGTSVAGTTVVPGTTKAATVPVATTVQATSTPTRTVWNPPPVTAAVTSGASSLKTIMAFGFILLAVLF